MAEKKTHFGRAGEYFAMSELLLRGWNVAVPVVDVGDDVFVIDDNDKSTWRLQVKSSETEKLAARDGAPEGVKASFTLSRVQLRTVQPIELFYMLMLRLERGWRFLVVGRSELSAIRDAFVEGGKAREGPGRPPVRDEKAKTDSVTIVVELRGADAQGWGTSLTGYLDRWPDALAPVKSGPGSVTRPAATPAPSPGREK